MRRTCVVIGRDAAVTRFGKKLTISFDREKCDDWYESTRTDASQPHAEHDGQAWTAARGRAAVPRGWSGQRAAGAGGPGPRT